MFFYNEQTDRILDASWTTVSSHPLSSTPQGAIVDNGANGTQGPASVGGRTAWKQTADWNEFHIPLSRSTTDLEAVQVDVYHSGTNSYANFNPFSYKDGAGNSQSSLNYRLSTSEQYIISSATQLANRADIGIPSGQWVTLRAEMDRSIGDARFLLNGSEQFRLPIDLSVFDATYMLLSSQVVTWANGAFAVNISWSNLLIQQGS
jgi:hypothetical protein